MSPAGTSTSVGTAIYLYAAVLGTPLDVMLVVTLGVLLCFPEINDKRRHILNTPLYKMLFNVFNISLSMGLASVFFKFYQGDFNIVVYALVMFVVLAAEELINGFILYQYFSIQPMYQSDHRDLGPHSGTKLAIPLRCNHLHLQKE